MKLVTPNFSSSQSSFDWYFTLNRFSIRHSKHSVVKITHLSCFQVELLSRNLTKTLLHFPLHPLQMKEKCKMSASRVEKSFHRFFSGIFLSSCEYHLYHDLKSVQPTLSSSLTSERKSFAWKNNKQRKFERTHVVQLRENFVDKQRVSFKALALSLWMKTAGQPHLPVFHVFLEVLKGWKNSLRFFLFILIFR